LTTIYPAGCLTTWRGESAVSTHQIWVDKWLSAGRLSSSESYYLRWPQLNSAGPNRCDHRWKQGGSATSTYALPRY